MIQLTTPFNPGDADPDHQYTHIKITDFHADISNGLIMITARHGYLEDEEWVGGVHLRGQTLQSYAVENDNYVTLVSKMTIGESVLIYGEVSRELYQYLLDKEHFAGEVV